MQLQNATPKGSDNVINARKLMGLMVEKGMTQLDLAEAIGKKRAVISLKINNKRVMYLDEAEKIAELLEIKESDFGTYFFYHPVA